MQKLRRYEGRSAAFDTSVQQSSEYGFNVEVKMNSKELKETDKNDPHEKETTFDTALDGWTR